MTRYPRVWKTDGNQRVRKMIADTLRRWRKERRRNREAAQHRR